MRALLGAPFALLLLVSSPACELKASETVPIPTPSARTVEVEPREQLLPTYPCSGCHANRQPKPERHELKEFHAIRNSEFSHGEDAFWCYQCHSKENIDRLVTATGELVTFNEAMRICTSCHGDKLEDWKRGTHGLILGNWNGVKHKKSCPACHDPHNPRFPSLEPEKPPQATRGLKAL